MLVTITWTRPKPDIQARVRKLVDSAKMWADWNYTGKEERTLPAELPRIRSTWIKD